MTLVLRTHIDGIWSVAEFADFTSEMQFLYDFGMFSQSSDADHVRLIHQFTDGLSRFFDQLPEPAGAPLKSVYVKEVFRLFWARARTEPWRRDAEDAFTVRRIEFSSPGVADFAGLGKIVEQVRLFIKDLLERHDATKDRVIARELAQQDVLSKKIKNASALMKLADSMKLEEQARVSILSAVLGTENFLLNSFAEGKITSVEIVDEGT